MKIIKKKKFVISTKGYVYLVRWYLIPKNRFLNIYLHLFIRDDWAPELHDHPWFSVSYILRGHYYEQTEKQILDTYQKGDIIFRRPKFSHRIMVPFCKKKCWSIFITGPKIREWGFHTDKGWIDSKIFIAKNENT